MTGLDFLSGLTWPGAFTIIGSIVAVVGGMLALYANYLKASLRGTNAQTSTIQSALSAEDIQLHERISALRDRLAACEGQLGIVDAQLKNVNIRIKEHEQRDVQDFKTINHKVDRLMEIIVEMLKKDVE